MTQPPPQTAPKASPFNQGIGFLKALRKRWALVVACTLLSAGAILIWSKVQRKVYQASSLLEIDRQVAQPLGSKTEDVLDIGAGSYWDTRDYYETQYKVITSDRVLGTVVRDLGLVNDADFLDKPKAATPATVDETTTTLRSRVTVDPVRNSRLVYVRVDDTNPGRAKRICDAVARTYIDQNLQLALTATSDAVVWLNGQVDHIKDDLEHDENALYEFKQRNDLPSTSINETSNMLRVEMQELDTALTRTRTKHAELAARQAELSIVSADSPDQLPASELLASPFLQSLRTQHQSAVQEHDTLLAEGKGENHPLVRRAAEKVTEAKAALLAEVKNIQGAVERDLAIVVRQEAAEGNLFEATRRRAVDLNMKEIEYHRLDRTREQNEKLFGLLLERLKESDLARMMKVNNIRVVDMASEPRMAIRPRVALNLAIGFLVGLAVGLALALLREQMDSSVKTPDDLEAALRVTFLGLLPDLGDDTAVYGSYARKSRRQRSGAAATTGPMELAVHERPLSGIAEAARSIRTNLIFMNPDRPYRRLLVTSAAPSEGKTTVACSIAIALAQGGQRVCLVDCDLRRPRLHRIFHRAGDAGVTNALVGEASLDDVCKPTGIDNLWSVPAGAIPPNPADVLHSERFRKFIEDLTDRFDRIVIDSPPLVAVTDAAIMSRLVDGTVVVVRAFQTSKQLCTQGIRVLHDVDAPIVGGVLNAVNLSRHEYTHYYHYYYYKREGYRSSPASTDGRDDDAAASPPN